MKRESITIKGETYAVGFSFRANREFELLAQKSISQCTSEWDSLLYFYCDLKALNENFTMSLDDFCDYLDENPQTFIDFISINAFENDPTPQPPQAKKKVEIKQLFGLWMLSLLLLALPVWLPVISTIACLWLSLWLLGRLIAKIGKKRA